MNIGKMITDAAPHIGGAIAGAGGTLVGNVAKMALKKVLNLPDDAKDTQIETILANPSPELMLKLKEADNQFKLEMQKTNVDLERIAAGDRDSARNRDIKTNDGMNEKLALFSAAQFVVVFALLMFFPIPDGVREPLMILLGILAANNRDAFQYYFGSSSGSARKNDIIHGLKKSQ